MQSHLTTFIGDRLILEGHIPEQVLSDLLAAPDGAFLARLSAVFGEARAEPIRFWNALADTEEVNTIYVAKR